MIGTIVAAVREHVVAPQAAVDDPERRAWAKGGGNMPLNVEATTLETFGLTTTPVNPEIGHGFLNLRHVVAVVLSVEDVDADEAVTRRDPIAADLLARVLRTDWPNVDVSSPDVAQDIVSVTAAVEWADIVTGQAAAYATITLTVDTEWRL